MHAIGSNPIDSIAFFSQCELGICIIVIHVDIIIYYQI